MDLYTYDVTCLFQEPQQTLIVQHSSLKWPLNFEIHQFMVLHRYAQYNFAICVACWYSFDLLDL